MIDKLAVMKKKRLSEEIWEATRYLQGFKEEPLEIEPELKASTKKNKKSAKLIPFRNKHNKWNKGKLSSPGKKRLDALVPPILLLESLDPETDLQIGIYGISDNSEKQSS